MSTSLIVDTMDETTVKRDESGWYATRTALMIGLTGNPSAIVYNALTDALLTTNNYAFGYVHPTMTALYCASCTGVAADRDKVKITSEYRPFQSLFIASATQTGILNIGASVQTVTTNRDINGAVMSVTGPSGSSPSSIVGTVNVDSPTIVLQFARKEPGPPSETVLSMVNTVGQYAATIGGRLYPAYTLKLNRIQADVQDNGSGTNEYKITYEFLYRPLVALGTYAGSSGWKTYVVYQDSTGTVPGTATEAANTAAYWNYAFADFSTLYLW